MSSLPPVPSDASAPAPPRWLCVRLALAAVVVRCLPLALLFGKTSTTWNSYLSGSDAGSFLPMARVIYGLAPLSAVKVYDTRVFPGWPLLLGLPLRLGLPEWSALALSLACSALVPILFLRLTGERRLAWLLVYFPPAWLLAGLHPISEPAYLALILAGLLALKYARPGLAGGVLGATFVLRPFGAAWAAGGWVAGLWSRPRDGRAALRFALLAAVPVAGLLVLNAAVFGDPLRQLHVYELPLDQLNLSTATAAQLGAAAGHWGPPFKYLLLTPWLTPVPAWKIAYIYAHAAALLVLVWRGVAFLRGPGEPWQRALVLGFLANAALIVCTGPYWGFHSFDRYFVWGLPGALWLARGWYTSDRCHWILAPVSLALATHALLSHAGG